VDDQDLGFPAAGGAQTLLGGGHEAPAEAAALPGRRHREQPEVPQGAAGLDVDAAGKAARLVGEQETAGFEMLPDIVFLDPRPRTKKASTP